jgi:predicted enzyme related to lactoylglutathione lyase
MQVTKYEPGTPSWADVSSTNLSATVEFYNKLFGWSTLDMGEQAGHYTMFQIDGKSVAAAGPKMPDDTSPSAWTTYVTVADADLTVAQAKAAGGMVIVEPMDVFDAGRMAIIADPTGGVFAVWQPGTSIGAERVNEPNTMCWNELTARDVDTLLPFYSTLFGWDVVKHDGDGQMTYRELHLSGKPVGGCIEMDANWPAGMPTHWMVYFAVDDCDAAAERAKALGGTVHVEPTDIPVGRFAVIQEPAGAVCSVIKLTRPM